MSTPAHRIHHDLYKGPKLLKDPGNAGIIRAAADLQICEMVTGASGETRTLANPTKPGIRFVLRLKTDGGGDAVVTAPAGLNVALDQPVDVTRDESFDFAVRSGIVGTLDFAFYVTVRLAVDKSLDIAVDFAFKFTVRDVTMSDLTVIYLTMNQMPSRWEQFHRDHLLRAIEDRPLVVISKEVTDWR